MNIADRSQHVTDSKDMLAKLLASENITVVRANLKTASFDTVNRVLRLPQWQNLNSDVEEMLIGHEVGHALYTTNDYMEECQSDSNLMGYMNVIEDVRIEKKIKNKYPGLRKSFTKAYRKLQEDDFFGIEKRDLSNLLLIDRINLYFKAGFTCGVKFTSEEAEIVKKVTACDSIHDVYELAVELLAYTKSEQEKKEQEIAQMKMSAQTQEDLDDEAEEDSDFEDEGDDYETYGQDSATGEQTQDDLDEDAGEDYADGPTGIGSEAGRADWEDEAPNQNQIESVTEKSLRNKLSDLADTDKQYINVQYDGRKAFNYDPIIGYKKILEEASHEHRDNGYNEFYNQINRDINYLVKEFEMRKQAHRMKRSTRAKTGDLAVNKLFAYKLNDDLFKRITVLPDGKNHGFIMLLDWSGSMYEHMQDTVKQCITMAMFMRRIQVPFRVFAFSDAYRDENYEVEQGFHTAIREHENARREQGSNFSMNKFHLLEFMSDKMSATDFTRMAKFMFSNPWYHSSKLNLGGTPLYEAMWWVVDYAGQFIRQNNIEKFSFITLTDGDGHPLYPNFETRTRIPAKDESNPARIVENSITIVDPKTKKTYSMGGMGRYRDFPMKNVLHQILKDRYNANVIGFFVTRNSARDIGWFFNSNCQMQTYSLEREKAFQQVRIDLRKNGFASGTCFGDDKTFILRADKLAIKEQEDMKVNSSHGAGSIARQFSKHLGANRSSKVMLNQFMELVA